MVSRSVIRQIGLQVLLIAVTIQGVTPHTFTILSPWVLGQNDPSADTGHADARYDGIPENDRPAPLNGTDHDEAPGEIVMPCAFRTAALIGRSPAFHSGRPAWANARHDTLISTRPSLPAPPATDPLSSQCRLTC